MKRKNFLRGFKIIFVLAVIFTFCSIVFNLEIAQIISNEETSILQDLEEKHPNSDISIISVQYTTGGTMWKLTESTAETKKGDMLLFSLFDPRCLKDNKQFLIDFHYDFIVCTPKKLSFLLGNRIKIVIPNKIYAKPRSDEIKNLNNSQFFYVSDLSFIGKAKIFLRCIIVLFSVYIVLYMTKVIANRKDLST